MPISTHGSGSPDTATLNDIKYLDTFWDDIANSLIGRQLASAAGKVGYDWDENTIVMSPSGDIAVANDRISFNLQLSHRMRVGSNLQLHIHWQQTSAAAIAFTVRTRLQKNGHATASAWVTTVAPTASVSAFPYTSGSLNQITSLVDIDLSDANLSDIVQIQFVRSDAEVGDINVLFVDAHFEIDTPGSREPYRK